MLLLEDIITPHLMNYSLFFLLLLLLLIIISTKEVLQNNPPSKTKNTDAKERPINAFVFNDQETADDDG